MNSSIPADYKGPVTHVQVFLKRPCFGVYRKRSTQLTLPMHRDNPEFSRTLQRILHEKFPKWTVSNWLFLEPVADEVMAPKMYQGEAKNWSDMRHPDFQINGVQTGRITKRG